MQAIQVAELFLKVGAKGIETFERDMKKADGVVAKVSKRMADAGKKMTLAISAPLMAVGTFSAKAAMEAVESENLFEVSMGRMADATRSWSEGLQKSLGLNGYAVRKMAGTFNVMLGSMGLTTDQAFDMSKGLTQLTYDMASFYNLRPEEAFEKLQAGISGEIEPLRRLGINILEEQVQQKAYQMGLAKTGDQLTQNQKILARYALIMDATSKAQGDLARTIESPANQMRLFTEQVNLLQVQLGQMLLPMVNKAVKEGQKLTKWLMDLPDSTKQAIVNIGLFVTAIGPLLIVLGSAHKGVLALVGAVKALGAAWAWLVANPYVIALAAITGLILWLGKLAKAHEQAKDKAVEQGIQTAKAQKESADKAKGLIAEYQALEQKTNKTAAEQAHMKALLAQLKALFPEVTDGAKLYGDALTTVEQKAYAADKRLKSLTVTQLQREKAKLEGEIQQYMRAQNQGAKQSFWGIIPTTKGMRENLKNSAMQAEIDARNKLAEVEAKLAAIRGESNKSAKKGTEDTAKAAQDELKAKEDLAAAEGILWDIRYRNAGKLKQLELDRDKALAEAKGPKTRAAIEKDFADKKKSLIHEIQAEEVKAETHVQAMRLQLAGRTFEAERVMAQAAFDQRVDELHKLQREGEDVDARILEAKTVLGMAIREINKRELEERQRIAESEKQAAESTVAMNMRAKAQEVAFEAERTKDVQKQAALRVRSAELEAEAQIQEARNAWAQTNRDLQERAKTEKNVSDRIIANNTQFSQKQAEITRQRTITITQIERDAYRKQLEDQRTAEQAKLSVWERVRDIIQRAELNLIRLTQGEAAARTEELKRQYDEERAYVEKSIADAEMKANVLQVLDEDYAARKDEIFAEESKQQDQRMGWLDQIQRRGQFTDVASQWKRMLESAVNMGGFGMPSMQGGLTPAPAVAQVSANASAAAALTPALLRAIADNIARSNTHLRDIDLKLTE